MKKERFLIRLAVISALLIACGIYAVVGLYSYINYKETWDNTAMQVFLQTTVIFIFMAGTLLIAIYLFWQREQELKEDIGTLKKESEDKNHIIEDLNDRISRRKIYDSEKMVLEHGMLEKYIDGIYRKDINEFTVIWIDSGSGDEGKIFLEHINYIKGENVEVFKSTAENIYMALFIGCTLYDAEQTMKYCLPGKTREKRVMYFTTNRKKDSVKSIIREFENELRR